MSPVCCIHVTELAKPPSVLIISNCTPGSVKVILSIAPYCKIQRIIKPVWTSAPSATKSMLERLKRLLRRPIATIIGRTNEHYRSYALAGVNSEVQKLLQTSIDQLPQGLISEIAADKINAPTIEKLIQDATPDIILLCGAPILKETVFKLSRLGSLNVHLGIAPNYRGEHTILWPLLCRDYGSIGATVHHVTSKVDAGAVIARVFPKISPRDNESSLLAKAYQEVGRLLQEILTQGAAQDRIPTGKEFPLLNSKLIKYRDRTLATGVLQILVRILGNPPPETPERIERYYDP